MGNSGAATSVEPQRGVGRNIRYDLIVVVFAAIIYIASCFSPPTLMDDVDAVQAQIARNMLDSGDWVTARLDGVKYLEKSPLKYWMIAVSYILFGVHDWSARIPVAISTIFLCWITARFARWAFGEKPGFYAGLVLSTCIGLWLFTRILIPDVILTLTITLAMWGFLRALDDEEARPRLWAAIMAAAIGTGLLLKGLIAAVFPIGAALVYLGFSGQIKSRRAWSRLHIPSGILIALAIAAPWHVLATLRNPPYFDLTMKSEPGKYHGFFWFYFLNEHVFRFLNMRYPRDYNTVPRPLFWAFHLLWLFPWSAYFPALAKLRYRGEDRAARTRLLALCWTGFILVFFTFSTTQEYYSMPCYPALALLLGCAISSPARGMLTAGTRVIFAISAAAAVAIAAILIQVRNLPTPGDISKALTQHPDAYTLSLGHMGDLTIASFAYLRFPLVLAGVAFLIGAAGSFRFQEMRTYIAVGIMMVLFFLAARSALVAFDPYLGSRPLADALNRAPQGELIISGAYYPFSSVFFYTNRRALILNGRINNLEYGSYAPDAPHVFIDDQEYAHLWSSPERYYIVAEEPSVDHLRSVAGASNLHTVAESGGKFLFVNHADLH